MLLPKKLRTFTIGLIIGLGPVDDMMLGRSCLNFSVRIQNHSFSLLVDYRALGLYVSHGTKGKYVVRRHGFALRRLDAI